MKHPNYCSVFWRMRGNRLNVGNSMFCRVSKASRERMESWSVLPRSICVCAPCPHCTSPFSSLQQVGLCLAYGGQKDPHEIMGALKWMFVQGYLCPGEKRGQFLCPLGSSGGMWCSCILTSVPLKPRGIVTPIC